MQLSAAEAAGEIAPCAFKPSLGGLLADAVYGLVAYWLRDDSEEFGNPKTNGVIKLRLLCSDQPVDARASAVKCSLVCDPKSEKRTWLDKNIKRLSICERLTHEGERAVFVVASITFGFSVWCITHKLFKEMSSSAVKIPPFK